MKNAIVPIIILLVITMVIDLAFLSVVGAITLLHDVSHDDMNKVEAAYMTCEAAEALNQDCTVIIKGEVTTR